MCDLHYFTCFFFNDTATTEIYTLSLHDALPISSVANLLAGQFRRRKPPTDRLRLESRVGPQNGRCRWQGNGRSEEHTSELQSRQYLVCRLLLEKKKHITTVAALATIKPDMMKYA